MSEMALGLIVLIALSALFGLIAGRMLGKASIDKEVNKAFEEGQSSAKESAEKDKAELSGELGEQLDKIRDSILQSAEAYHTAVKTVEDKLSNTIDAEHKKLDKVTKLNLELISDSEDAQAREEPVTEDTATEDPELSAADVSKAANDQDEDSKVEANTEEAEKAPNVEAQKLANAARL